MQIAQAVRLLLKPLRKFANSSMVGNQRMLQSQKVHFKSFIAVHTGELLKLFERFKSHWENNISQIAPQKVTWIDIWEIRRPNNSDICSTGLI